MSQHVVDKHFVPMFCYLFHAETISEFDYISWKKIRAIHNQFNVFMTGMRCHL